MVAGGSGFDQKKSEEDEMERDLLLEEIDFSRLPQFLAGADSL